MKQFIAKVSYGVPTLLLALTSLVAMPVFAEQGSTDSSSDTTTTVAPTQNESGSTQSSESGDTPSGGTQHKDSPGATDHTASAESSHSGDATTASDTETELHAKGADLVDQLEKNQKTQHSDAQKKQACEAHKQGLQTKFASISKNAAALQDRITTILTEAQSYQQTSGVTVANWSALVAAATAAQQASVASITTMQGITPTLDCNSTSVASDVAAFKVAAQDVRTNLQAYKTAVQNVIQALESAKTATTAGGNQ